MNRFIIVSALLASMVLMGCDSSVLSGPGVSSEHGSGTRLLVDLPILPSSVRIEDADDGVAFSVVLNEIEAAEGRGEVSVEWEELVRDDGETVRIPAIMSFAGSDQWTTIQAIEDRIVEGLASRLDDARYLAAYLLGLEINLEDSRATISSELRGATVTAMDAARASERMTLQADIEEISEVTLPDDAGTVRVWVESFRLWGTSHSYDIRIDWDLAGNNVPDEFQLFAQDDNSGSVIEWKLSAGRYDEPVWTRTARNAPYPTQSDWHSGHRKKFHGFSAFELRVWDPLINADNRFVLRNGDFDLGDLADW